MTFGRVLFAFYATLVATALALGTKVLVDANGHLFDTIVIVSLAFVTATAVPLLTFLSHGATSVVAPLSVVVFSWFAMSVTVETVRLDPYTVALWQNQVWIMIPLCVLAAALAGLRIAVRSQRRIDAHLATAASASTT